MDLAELKENIITETLDYRGQKVVCGFAPDVLTSADGELAVAEYVFKALKSWDITVEKVPLEISVHALASVIPGGLLTLMFDRLLALREVGMGKLKALKN